MEFAPSPDDRWVLDAVATACERFRTDAADWDARGLIDPAALGLAAELGLGALFLAESRGGVPPAVGLLALAEVAERSAALAARIAVHAAVVAPWLAGGSEPPPSDGSWSGLVFGPGGFGIGLDAERVFVLSEERFRGGGAFAALDGLGLRGAGLGRMHPPLSLPDPNDPRLSILRLAVAAVAVGVGRAAVTAAKDHALGRKQFGRPIADFQAVQWMLADAATEVEAAQLLVVAGGLEGGGDGRAALAFATEAAHHAAHAAIQIHGGSGFVRDFPVERLARDARTLGVLFGPLDDVRHEIGARCAGR